ncbi:aminotransferase class V-fold PLP-dependent enzyme [Streptomyces longwoodensis]|uniref:pyridoxal-phosphate-dependent aminotransferase family protein n=1 Tax=Streptomyces longwoodensis TaxID=68231 RepID=UPI0022586405|nr:aminotransferase class V-fold PLP-dependent enzyme [Streptomyces longwoodensis]MCX4999032.1 aminotransferase class V-fold PLP-dependent enzyme [Streptomyces longwoodensis]WRY87913.1 aminotransferase class V-fold PLP-dependent enzyme [Streptomyces longwoodensis]WTI47799.1 aminotransferase class V-fold PLP-dependent enzyme [Streptomyces longwoodensis]WUC60537.1 aminotransferase class V-fold PLP-dependent enzyme [Streptomyces longwoodensis]WUC74072.1 aminotransferase class V-fold PLP-dependent
MTHPFLDLAPLSAARFASIEDRVAKLLDTRQDVVVTQGEALLPLEGAIRATAGPGTTALNVITGPYGQTFGDWLRDCGATVIDLAVPFHTAVKAAQVREAFAEHPEIDFVSLVHAEAATGNTNPVAEIGEAVRAQGALFYLDAVASVGAEPVLPDAWGVDLCVIGAQKAMGGPAGVSAVSVSERAWARMAANPRAPRRSYLSLLDWKERWIDGGRKALLHAPAQLEMLALEACLERIEAEGLDAVMARHASAAAATRAGVAALGGGLEPYVHEAGEAAPVATTLRTPDGVVAAELVARALAADPALPLAAGGGALAREMIRVNHYGPDATPGAVRACLAALGTALAESGADDVDVTAALRAAAEEWR